MLIAFSVHNFRSIRDLQTLSLEARKDEHLAWCNVLEDGKLRLNIDTDKLGFVPAAKVDEIRSVSFAKGAEKAKSELLPTLTEREELTKQLQAQLDAAKKGSGAAGIEAEKLRQELADLNGKVRTLHESAEAERSERKRLSLENSIKDTLVSLPLSDGGKQAFLVSANAAVRVRQDGTNGFALSSGAVGSLDEFSSEWRNTPLGKMSILSTERGGTGAGLKGVVGGDIPKTAAEKTEFVAKHGIDAFRAKLETAKKK